MLGKYVNCLLYIKTAGFLKYVCVDERGCTNKPVVDISNRDYQRVERNLVFMNTGTERAKMYFIAVVLPVPLDEKVQALKQWMKEAYGCKVGLKSPAHITIVPPFWLNEEKESRLRSDIEAVAGTVPDFLLTTDNFSAFRPRTIFVALANNEQLNAVKSAADNFFRHSDYKIKIDARPFHPHITIATRDLLKRDFAEAWPHFEHREFRETCKANGLSLLKHNGQKWDVVFTAPFKTAAQERN